MLFNVEMMRYCANGSVVLLLLLVVVVLNNGDEDDDDDTLNMLIKQTLVQCAYRRSVIACNDHFGDENHNLAKKKQTLLLFAYI